MRPMQYFIFGAAVLVTLFSHSSKTLIFSVLVAALYPYLAKSMYFFILLGFSDNKVLVKYFYIFIFCSGRAVQRYLDNENPTLISDWQVEYFL